MVDVLPRKVEEHEFTIRMFESEKNQSKKRNKQFKISATRIRAALEWLKLNNPNYADITIDDQELAKIEKVNYYQDLEGAKVEYVPDEKKVNEEDQGDEDPDDRRI